MTVNESSAAGRHEYEGVVYYFCNPRCLERFKADPPAYLRQDPASRTMPPMIPAAAPAASGTATTEYTCPMHPEIVRSAPGPCPICGMALEPRVVSLSDAPNPELVDMARRFRIAAMLGAPVFLVTMADML